MNSRICYIVILLCFFACHSDRYQEKATRLYEYGIEIESFQPDSAAYLYRRALSLTSPNSDLSVALHLRLGNLLRTHHLYNRALEEHTIALKECMANDSTKYTARALREVGKDYLYKNSPDSALGYIKEALSLSEAASDTLEMTAAHNNLSVVYGELKDLEQATKHAYRAISLSKDSTLIYRTYSAIGKMFLLSGQYDSAYHYSRQGSLSPNIYTRANSYKQLCEVALETKNGALYEECVNLLNLANDSIEKINRTESMGETEYQYDLEQILYTEKTRYYRWIAVVIIGALLILFLYIQKRRSRDKAWKAQVEARKRRREGLKKRQRIGFFIVKSNPFALWVLWLFAPKNYSGKEICDRMSLIIVELVSFTYLCARSKIDSIRYGRINWSLSIFALSLHSVTI